MNGLIRPERSAIALTCSFPFDVVLVTSCDLARTRDWPKCEGPKVKMKFIIRVFLLDIYMSVVLTCHVSYCYYAFCIHNMFIFFYLCFCCAKNELRSIYSFVGTWLATKRHNVTLRILLQIHATKHPMPLKIHFPCMDDLREMYVRFRRFMHHKGG